MKLRATIANLLASGFVTACCFSPVNESIVQPTIDGGGDGGDAGPSVDGGPTRCTIGGVGYADGDVDPLHPCQHCDPAQSTSHWSYASDRTGCGDGRYCFRGICENACVLDDGSVVPPTTGDGCRFCNEQGSWTPLPDGTPCMLPGGPATETLFCFNGYCAPGCVIGGIPESAGTRNPQNSCQYCGAPSSGDWTSLPSGSPCADGGICDQNGNCGPVGCSIVSPSGTVAQYQRGASSPYDTQLCCNPALNPSGWSARLVLAQTLPADGPPTELAAGDFNGDGWLDLAAITGSVPNLTLTIFLSQQGILQPSFTYAISAGSAALATADLNGDRFDDLIVADNVAQTLRVWLSNGDGTLGTPSDYPAGPAGHGSVKTADFNGDGIPDLVSGSGPILYFQGIGNGALQPFSTLSYGQGGEQRFSVGDLNGDHTPDVALAAFSGGVGNVLGYLGNGSGGFSWTGKWTALDLSPNALTDIAEDDLDGDGFRDLALTTRAGPGGWTEVGWLQGFGEGSFGPWTSFNFTGPNDGDVMGLAIADLDGDGRAEVLYSVLIFSGPGNYIWEFYQVDAVTNVTSAVLSDTALRWPLVRDFNQDGALDVVGVGDPDAGAEIALYLNGCP